MQNLNYWKQFESTGKIEDYLSYCGLSSANEEKQQKPASKCAGELGEHSYAGVYMCNRNDIETDAYRGI